METILGIRSRTLKLFFAVLLTAFSAFGEDEEEIDKDSVENQYFRLQKEMGEHYARVQVLKQELQVLIATKRQAKDRDALDTAMKSITKNYAELRNELMAYNKTVDEMKYRFPNKGQESEKKYRALKLDSLETEAKESGLDLRLTELRDQVSQAYQKLPDEENPLIREKPKNLYPTTTLPKREVYEF